MKINAQWLLLVALILIAGNSNPGTERHKAGIMEGMKRLSYHPDPYFIASCEFHDYGLFSFSSYLGAPVSLGVFGNVHVLYAWLRPAMDDFSARHTLLPNHGPGSTGYLY